MRRQTEWPPIETSQMRKPLIVCVCPVDFNPNAQGERLQTQLVYEALTQQVDTNRMINEMLKRCVGMLDRPH